MNRELSGKERNRTRAMVVRTVRRDGARVPASLIDITEICPPAPQEKCSVGPGVSYAYPVADGLICFDKQSCQFLFGNVLVPGRSVRPQHISWATNTTELQTAQQTQLDLLADTMKRREPQPTCVAEYKRWHYTRKFHAFWLRQANGDFKRANIREARSFAKAQKVPKLDAYLFYAREDIIDVRYLAGVRAGVYDGEKGEHILVPKMIPCESPFSVCEPSEDYKRLLEPLSQAQTGSLEAGYLAIHAEAW